MDSYTDNKKNEFYIQWHFIDSCNLRCIHCYQNDYLFKEPDLNKLSLIFHKLDDALAKWKMGGFVSLTGGEPFLSPSSLFYVAELIENSPNFQNVAILSNGTLIDENIIKEIKRFKKITEIQISIDGPDVQMHESIRGKGTFLKTVETVRELVSAGLKTSIMFTLHKKNMDRAEDMLYLAKELKVNSLTIERMTTMNEKEKNEFFIDPYDLERIYKSLYEKSKAVFAGSATKLVTSRPLWNLVDENAGGFCPIGLSSVCILHDGTVLPCRRLYLPLGNIIEEGLFKIWYGSKILWDIRNKKNPPDNSGVHPQSACSDINCSHFKRCGGCKAVSYYYHGNIHEKDPQCWLN